ncbi:PolyC-binding proteins alphaCP-1 [Handroanthus impetiginosus]|uniref:PolyC-binding proteins alphaCP-1 n=1 Tax=Handroanthus impetiginosus TaxID=429701 RepID=A0A2G9IBI4_9LAMI|nr:PolyC-binding proteins alphaCP-1 [Handroanthus impetiginosus]
MERSRSKRYYYDQDYESETLHSRSKPRYGNNPHVGGGGGGHHYGAPGFHRRPSSSGGGGRKMQDPSVTVTTSFRILCHDVKAGGVIGKNGGIIKAIRQHTGASINVHDVIPGDEERIIEITDTRRRDPEGRMPSFSPAQEALFLIHERILETELSLRGDDNEYGSRGSGGGGGSGNRVVTRLVVSRMHVGSLLGKGGKIIEQMKAETNTHIRILPRDQTLPRCVAMSEEIVQVVGDVNAVKNAIASISSRLRESQHRDRSHFNNRLNSPDDDFHTNSTPKRLSAEGPSFGTRYSGLSRNNSYSSRSSEFVTESGPASVADNSQSFSGEVIVFRILCPVDKIDRVIGESDGILDLLQNEIGVSIEVSDPVAGSDEHIIIISSNEGPDDELFPAQEALLHIQTHIVDLAPEKENIITTRLLLQSDETGSLRDLGKMGAANVEIRPRDEVPAGVSETDEIVQIVGEIKAARVALMEVTSRLRSYLYREILEKDTRAPHVSASTPVDTTVESETAPRNIVNPSVETQAGNGPVVSAPPSSSTAKAQQKVKDVGPPNFETIKQNESERHEDQPSGSNRYMYLSSLLWHSS